MYFISWEISPKTLFFFSFLKRRGRNNIDGILTFCRYFMYIIISFNFHKNLMGSIVFSVSCYLKRSECYQLSRQTHIWIKSVPFPPLLLLSRHSLTQFLNFANYLTPFNPLGWIPNYYFRSIVVIVVLVQYTET